MKPDSNLPPTIYHLPLVVIVGPTASGKTSLAIDLAKKCGGEIICADSRSIYKGADIGTAKPSAAEQSIVPHWGLDLVNPGDYYSAADFKAYANQKVSEIRSRGNIPFLVGGTGLYVDAVIFDYKFGQSVDNELRSKLQRMSLNELYIYCEKNNVILPENYKNKRYVVRSIEKMGESKTKSASPIKNTIVVGIATEKDTLRTRIAQRTDELFNDGVIDEAKILGAKYGWSSEAMKSNIYPLVHLYIQGLMTIDEVRNRYITLDWRLAKRQMTWLRRNKFIQWLSLDDAEKYIINKLAIPK